MDIVIKKKSKEPIDNRVSYPSTTQMKLDVDKLKNEKGIDVNEMLRQYTAKIIETANSDEKQPA